MSTYKDWGETPLGSEALKSVLILHHWMRAHEINGSFEIQVHYKDGSHKITKVIGPDLTFRTTAS